MMLNKKQLLYLLRRGAIVRLQIGHEISVYSDNVFKGYISLEAWHELRKLEKLEFIGMTADYMDYRISLDVPQEYTLNGNHFKYIERDAHNIRVKHFESGRIINVPYNVWLNSEEEILNYVK